MKPLKIAIVCFVVIVIAWVVLLNSQLQAAMSSNGPLREDDFYDTENNVTVRFSDDYYVAKESVVKNQRNRADQIVEMCGEAGLPISETEAGIAAYHERWLAAFGVDAMRAPGYGGLVEPLYFSDEAVACLRYFEKEVWHFTDDVWNLDQSMRVRVEHILSVCDDAGLQISREDAGIASVNEAIISAVGVAALMNPGYGLDPIPFPDDALECLKYYESEYGFRLPPSQEAGLSDLLAVCGYEYPIDGVEAKLAIARAASIDLVGVDGIKHGSSQARPVLFTDDAIECLRHYESLGGFDE